MRAFQNPPGRLKLGSGDEAHYEKSPPQTSISVNTAPGRSFSNVLSQKGMEYDNGNQSSIIDKIQLWCTTLRTVKTQRHKMSDGK